jgi:hypothetical protein
MTDPINPTAPGGPAARASGEPRPAASGDFAAVLAATSGAPQASDSSVEPAPPAAVQADMAAASRTWHTLAANGQELRFDDDAGGRVQVAVHHVSGDRIAVLALDDMYALIERQGSA